MRRTFIAMLAAISSLTVLGQTPIVRAKFEPSRGILVGQPVRLVVSIFVPNYFAGAPDFPEFEIENAIVVLPQDRPQNSNEQIGGVTYAGITETYVVYPQQPGDFKLPAAQITVPYAIAPPKTATAHVPLPALTFHADVPLAAKSLDYFLPTTSLTIQQKWSAPLKSLRAGYSVERTITVTATKMQAMLIPPLPLETPEGIRIYEEEPIVQDQKTDRGEFVYGRRTQSAKYFIRKAGDYTLPAVELKWWNLSTNRLVTATLPAAHFTVAANPDYVAELPPEQEPVPVKQLKHVSLWSKYKFWIRVAAPCFVAFIFLLWMAWHYFPRIYRRLQAWHYKREHSEPAYFRDLQFSCRRSHAMQAYDRFLRWLTLAHPGMPVHEFLRQADDPVLFSEINDLSASLYAKNNQGPHPWNGERMAHHLRQHRKVQNIRTMKRQFLPKLNP